MTNAIMTILQDTFELEPKPMSESPESGLADLRLVSLAIVDQLDVRTYDDWIKRKAEHGASILLRLDKSLSS